MAFIVEDGTIVPGATSYASVEYADAYFGDRLNTAWADLSPESKQSNLIIATDYIKIRWEDQLLGKIVDVTQPLLFPRIYGCEDVGVLPDGVVRATCEYALRVGLSENSSLAPDVAYDETGRLASTSKEKVGPLEESRSWTSPNASSLTFLPYRIPDALMRAFVRVSFGRVIR